MYLHSFVQVYYRDDGRLVLKVDVVMSPDLTIRAAHKLAGELRVVSGVLCVVCCDFLCEDCIVICCGDCVPPQTSIHSAISV